MQTEQLLRHGDSFRKLMNSVPCDWQVDQEASVEIKNVAEYEFPATAAELYDLPKQWSEPFRAAMLSLPFNQPN
jgi:hypothetical protein